MTQDTTGTNDSPSMGMGCWLALVLLLVAVGGLARGLLLPDDDADAPVKVIPGSTWKLTIPTDLPTVNGLCRIASPRATIRLDGTDREIDVPIEGLNQDSWGDQTEVEMVTVNGVPVITGRKDVKMVYRLDLTQGADWVGKDGRLTLESILHYPFVDVDDVVVGSLLGGMFFENRTWDFRTEVDLHFVADKDDEAARRKHDKLLNFIFVVVGVLAVILGLVFGARSKKQPA